MLTFPNKLLAKALIQRANTTSVAAAMAAGDRENTRSTYILKVLNANPGTRAAVLGLALASNSAGQKQLACILTVFDALSPAQKAAYIESYKTCAAIASLGTRDVAYQSTWQPGHIPPRFVP